MGGSEPSQILLSLGPLKAVGRTLQRECYLVPAASAVGPAETAAAEVPAPRMKKVQITAAASAAALQRAEVAEVEMMEVEVKGIDEAEAAVAQDEAAVAQACDYCNSRGKVSSTLTTITLCYKIVIYRPVSYVSGHSYSRAPPAPGSAVCYCPDLLRSGRGT